MEAIIILAENRPCRQDADFRALYTLPNELLSAEITEVFGNFLSFSDNTLAPQKSEILTVEENQTIIVLPLLGALEIKTTNPQNYLLGVGEISFFKHPKISLHNVYEDHLVNYLLISIKTANENNLTIINSFNLETHTNAFIDISNVCNSGVPKIYIGKFGAREEIRFELDENKKVFVYVISGVFEIENRLLEARTAIALWNLGNVEFEGLAAENILLLII